jgi:hypothetical protein
MIRWTEEAVRRSQSVLFRWLREEIRPGLGGVERGSLCTGECAKVGDCCAEFHCARGGARRGEARMSFG